LPETSIAVEKPSLWKHALNSKQSERSIRSSDHKVSHEKRDSKT